MKSTNPDYAPITMRRVMIIQERQERLFYALYAAIFVSFVGIMIALSELRKDIGRIK